MSTLSKITLKAPLLEQQLSQGGLSDRSSQQVYRMAHELLDLEVQKLTLEMRESRVCHDLDKLLDARAAAGDPAPELRSIALRVIKALPTSEGRKRRLDQFIHDSKLRGLQVGEEDFVEHPQSLEEAALALESWSSDFSRRLQPLEKTTSIQ